MRLAVVMALAAGIGVVSGYPNFVGCTRTLVAGVDRVMGQTIVASSSRTVSFMRAGSPIACGGTYSAGEVLSASLSNTGGQFYIQLTGGAAFDTTAKTCPDLSRVMQLSTNQGLGPFNVKMPASGDVVMTGFWAPGYGQVTAVPGCTLTLAAAVPLPAPTPQPTTSPTAKPTPVPGEPTNKPTTASPTTSPTPAPTPTPTTPQPSVAPTVVSCISDRAGYEFEYAFDSGLKLHWFLEANAVRFLLISQRNGWASMGFSSDGGMIGSNAVIGTATSLPQKYALVNKNTGSAESLLGSGSQTLTGTSSAAVGDTTELEFTVALDDRDLGVLSKVFIWAYGSDTLQYHDARGAVKLDLETCSSSTVTTKSVSSAKVKAHGIMMIFAMNACFPSGVLVAKLKIGSKWLYIHIFFQLAAIAVALSGVLTVVFAVENADNADHINGRHPKLGIALMSLAGFNILLGMVRPHKHKSTGPDDHEGPTVQRRAFELTHKSVGYSFLVFAVFVAISGINRAEALFHISSNSVRAWTDAVIALGVIFGAALVAALAYNYSAVKETSTCAPPQIKVSVQEGGLP